MSRGKTGCILPRDAAGSPSDSIVIERMKLICPYYSRYLEKAEAGWGDIFYSMTQKVKKITPIGG